MNTCEFKFFLPDEFLGLYADAMLRRVIDYAPYESTSTASVTKDGEQFIAQIEVYAAAGPFKGRGVAPDAKRAIDAAEDEVYRQLDVWHRHRFDHRAA